MHFTPWCHDNMVFASSVDSPHDRPLMPNFDVRVACIVHGDVIKWKHFPRYWPFVQAIHRWPANSPHKGQCCATLMFSMICAWTNDWVNNRDAGDLRPHRAYYVTVMETHWRFWNMFSHIDSLVQNRSNSSALVVELLQSCAKRSLSFSLARKTCHTYYGQ